MENDGSFENSSINNNNSNNSFNSSGTIQNIPHLKQPSSILKTKREFTSNLNKLINYLNNRTHHSNSSYQTSYISSLIKIKQDMLEKINNLQSQSSLQSINSNFHKSKNNQSDSINKINYNSNSYHNKQSQEKRNFNEKEHSENLLFRYCTRIKDLEMKFNAKASFMEKLELLFKKQFCEIKHFINSNQKKLNKLNSYRKAQHKIYHNTTSNKLKKETPEKNELDEFEDWTVSVSEDQTNNDNSIETKMNSARDDEQNSNDSKDNTNINSGSDIPEQQIQFIGINFGKSEIHSTRTKKCQFRTQQPKHQKQTFETTKKTFNINSSGFNGKLRYNNYGTNYNNGFHKKGKNTNK